MTDEPKKSKKRRSASHAERETPANQAVRTSRRRAIPRSARHPMLVPQRVTTSVSGPFIPNNEQLFAYALHQWTFYRLHNDPRVMLRGSLIPLRVREGDDIRLRWYYYEEPGHILVPAPLDDLRIAQMYIDRARPSAGPTIYLFISHTWGGEKHYYIIHPPNVALWLDEVSRMDALRD